MKMWPLLQGLIVTGTVHVPATATDATLDAGGLGAVLGVSFTQIGTVAPTAAHSFRLSHELVTGGEYVAPSSGQVTVSRNATAAEAHTLMYMLMGY